MSQPQEISVIGRDGGLSQAKGEIERVRTNILQRDKILNHTGLVLVRPSLFPA